MVDTFNLFFVLFQVLKPNLIKSEFKDSEVLKGVQVAACDMRYIDLNNDILKI